MMKDEVVEVIRMKLELELGEKSSLMWYLTDNYSLVTFLGVMINGLL